MSQIVLAKEFVPPKPGPVVDDPTLFLCNDQKVGCTDDQYTAACLCRKYFEKEGSDERNFCNDVIHSTDKKQKKPGNPYHRVLGADLTKEVNDGLEVLKGVKEAAKYTTLKSRAFFMRRRRARLDERWQAY